MILWGKMGTEICFVMYFLQNWRGFNWQWSLECCSQQPSLEYSLLHLPSCHHFNQLNSLFLWFRNPTSLVSSHFQGKTHFPTYVGYPSVNKHRSETNDRSPWKSMEKWSMYTIYVSLPYINLHKSYWVSISISYMQTFFVRGPFPDLDRHVY